MRNDREFIVRTLTDEELNEGNYAKNDFKTTYPRCKSITQFMYYSPIYRCIKKEGHTGLHKVVGCNKFGCYEGLWDDEKIINNIML